MQKLNLFAIVKIGLHTLRAILITGTNEKDVNKINGLCIQLTWSKNPYQNMKQSLKNLFENLFYMEANLITSY